MTDQSYANITDEMQKLVQETREHLELKITKILSDEGLSAEEKDKLCTEVHDELSEMKASKESLYKLLIATNVMIDEFETSLREAEKSGRKKIRIIPQAPTNAQIDIKEKKNSHFAQGITFYKLFWVFFIGSFGGVVVEVLWCIAKNGHYESRVGLIYGPFNLVYGFGAFALTACLYNYRNRNKINSFIGGFIVGSIIEYFCSWFQELVFGSTSWDYSDFAFNINGRICLLYSIFWGILGIVWIKYVYPIMVEWILKIPNKVGKPLTWILAVFMVFNSVATGLTVLRWAERMDAKPASNIIEEYIDVHYPDERMKKIFANLEFVN